MTVDTELTKSVETALGAFNEYKTLVEGIKTKQTTLEGKLDAFDLSKLDKLGKDMGDAIELSQKAEARAQAVEEQNKELEAQYKALETAFNRAPAATAEEKGKGLAALRTKAFNDFARHKGKEDFADYLAKRAESEPEIKTLSVGTDPAGGYLVMPEFGGVIQAKVFESSPVRMLASVTTIGSDSVDFVLDNDEAASGWVNETGTRSETNTPTLGKLSIVAEELYAKPKATQKMLEDSSIDIEAWRMQKVADKFARDEATAFVSGNGVGKPRGLASYTAGTDISQQQVEQIASGSASTFTYDGLINLQNALKEPYQSGAVWLSRRATMSHMLLIKDGEGRPIFNMDYTRNGGTPASLLGSPVYFAADVAAVASNALAAIYGDVRTAYQIVDRRGISVLRDPHSSKPYVEFYTTKRVGGAVINFEAVKLGKVSS
jgi:HK97 family phage major capsid protein